MSHSVTKLSFHLQLCLLHFRTVKMMKNIASNVSVTVITGNYYDEQMPGPLNKVGFSQYGETMVSIR